MSLVESSNEIHHDTTTVTAVVMVGNTYDSVCVSLYEQIISIYQSSIQDHHHFTIALSGGSLPKILSQFPKYCVEHNITIQYDTWYVLLADERVVVSTDPDNNYTSIHEQFIQHTTIPISHIYTLSDDDVRNMMMMDDTTTTIEIIAQQYDTTVRHVLTTYSNGYLDCALLGFGPDGTKEKKNQTIHFLLFRCYFV